MAYYLNSDDRTLLKQLRLTHVCSVCGGGLEAFYDPAQHLPYLQCKNDPAHEGIGKPNRKEENSYGGGIRQMVELEQQHGLDKARQLAKYSGVASLTRTEAMEILETIWPEAPASDKLAAAMLCASYQLNPLANHVFLVLFGNEWVRMLGIKAKRLMASRKGGYSYLDMTPRLMTDEEQIKVWGAVDKENLCYMTWLKDTKTGAEVYGYGKYPNDKHPKGENNGNSQANMASIRSESQALDRLRPAEMPIGFTVVDENYIDAEVMEVLPIDDSSKREEAKREPPEPEKVAAKTKAKSARDPATIKNIGDLRQALLDDFGLQPAQQLAELNLKSWTDLSIPAEAYAQVAVVRQAPNP